MARFKPGQSGNPAGKPAGTKSKNAEQLRRILVNFIDANIESLQADFDKLKRPIDRLNFVEKLLKHVLPAPQDELMKLSDEDLDRLAERLKNEHLKIV